MDARPDLTLIGTGHVFRIEHTIRDAIVALRPDVVFVELDRARLQALLHRRATGENPPATGSFVQRRMAKFQQGVAARYGGDVGGEMIAAVEAAGTVGAKVHLVDRPAQTTIARALKQLTWREKSRALGLFLRGSMARLRPGKQPDIEDEVLRYQEDPLAALEELRGRFPTIHRVVIAERDALMAGHIRKAMATYERGVAIVGDGHVPGMAVALADFEPTLYRLPEVRSGHLPTPWTVADDGNTVSYGFEL